MDTPRLTINETPRLALRFRDATPGIDSIIAHRSIINSKGSVWWGWWKKNFEPSFNNLFSRLSQEGSGFIYLIDKSTDKCFQAHYIEAFALGQGTVDTLKVPEYYRTQISDIAGWFLLNDIKEVPYIKSISLRLGESTLLVLDGSESTDLIISAKDSSTFLEPDDKETRSIILHLSDLHFGADFAFLTPGDKAAIGENKQSLTKCLIEDLNRLGVLEEVGTIIISGDFTTQGDWSDKTKNQIITELHSLCEALSIDPSKIITLPGNHDVVRYPPGIAPEDIAKINTANQIRYKHEDEYRLFTDELTGRGWREHLNFQKTIRLNDIDIIICALNSCTIAATEWTEYGYVGDYGLEILNSIREIAIQRPTYRILAIHHHLIPINNVEAPNSKGVSLTLDAVQLLKAAQRSGIHITLHGHLHLPKITRYEQLPLLGESNSNPIIIVSGGSAGANRLPGSSRNSYSLLRFNEQEVNLIIKELRTDAEEGATLYNAILPITPAQLVTDKKAELKKS